MKIRRCPKCKNDKVELYAGLVTGSYYCRKCGLITPIIMEEDIELENKKKIK